MHNKKLLSYFKEHNGYTVCAFSISIIELIGSLHPIFARYFDFDFFETVQYQSTFPVYPTFIFFGIFFAIIGLMIAKNDSDKVGVKMSKISIVFLLISIIPSIYKHIMIMSYIWKNYA